MHQNNLIPSDAAAVTPANDTPVDFVGLYVGGAGNVEVRTGKGNVRTFQDVPAGTTIALKIIEVRAATTATKLTGYIA